MVNVQRQQKQNQKEKKRRFFFYFKMFRFISHNVSPQQQQFVLMHWFIFMENLQQINIIKFYSVEFAFLSHQQNTCMIFIFFFRRECIKYLFLRGIVCDRSWNECYSSFPLINSLHAFAFFFCLHPVFFLFLVCIAEEETNEYSILRVIFFRFDR